MVKQIISIGMGLSVLSLAAVANAQDVPWKVTGGTAVVQFWTQSMESHGIQVKNLIPTAFGNFPMEGGTGFKIESTSNLVVNSQNQVFAEYGDGSVIVKGGFRLQAGKNTVSMFNVSVRPNGPDQEAPNSVRDGLLGDLSPTLQMDKSITYLDVNRKLLTIGWADLRLSKEAAAALGKPELEGLLIGGFSIFASVTPLSDAETGGSGGGGFEDNTNADVNLFAMSGLTSMGRNGVAYPNGVSGFACSTTSCNKGTTNLDWFAPMNERHPVIVQDLFRVRLGRIEQIGSAYLKHGFFATNSSNSNCGTGVHPGTGTLLGPGLTDTYGSGNNGDRYYLGPRSELNPFTGHWTAFGSFFDVGTGGATPDGNRSLTSGQANALPAHKNRVEVRDQDLIIPSGESRQYLYQAFYLCEAEINLANQIGVRQANIAWNGSSWSCSDSGSFIPNKTAIEQYVTMINAAKNLGAGDVNATVNKGNDLSEGWIYLSCNPIQAGGGLWRYELSLFNYTSDRQIRELRLPVMTGMNVSNIQFRDNDQDAGNEWTGSYSNGEIVWSTQTFAQNPNANSLKFGSLYNFSFTANVAPGTNSATLGLFKTGAVMTNTASLVGPPNGSVAPGSYTVILGLPGGGNLASLVSSDNDRLVINEDPNIDPIYPEQVIVNSTAPISSIGTLKLDLEAASDIDGRFMYVELFNWTTNQWESVDGFLLGVSDVTRTVNVTSNASRFVNSGTKQMRTRLTMDWGIAETVFLSTLKLDKVFFTVGL